MKAEWSEAVGIRSSDARSAHPQVQQLLSEAALSLGLTP